MKSKISVIMPVYNNEKYVFDAINSILSQTHNNIELLICDDGSTDNSKNIIKSFSDERIKFYENQINKGYLYSVNRLFSLCHGDYITFQDSDDTSDETRLEKQLKKFQEINELGICGTWASYYDENGEFLRDKVVPIEHKDIYEGLVKNNMFVGSSIMITKEVYLKYKGYNSYFDRIGGEDYYWSAMIVENTLSYNIPENLYRITTSKNSITRNIRYEKQLIVYDIIREVIMDVRSGKINWLENNQNGIIEKKEEKFFKPFIKDKSLIFRKKSFIASKNNEFLEALNYSIKGILKNPFEVLNLKCFIVNILFLLKLKKNN